MKSGPTTTGLHYWMLRVIEECDKVSANFSADPVHDLRVALRRCRSLADGMIAIDPDRNWKAMKKAGRRLFQRLGALRDVQIMMEWIEKLDLAAIAPLAHEQDHGATDEKESAEHSVGTTAATPQIPAHTLMRILQGRETDEKREARAALDDFDRKQWQQWSNSLPQRAARIRPGSAVFKHLALERWTVARELHIRALRNRSQVGFHTLRIGIKRFRYIVENFLPIEHKAWANDLKHMQDLLGEVHDLDVLWATAQSCHIFPDESSRKAWHEKILQERTQRIDEYRRSTTGDNSLWRTWRAGLPQGKQIQEIATQRMKLWAKALDPDFPHSERVARLSLQLFDGLMASGFFGKIFDADNHGNEMRSSLYAAALLHDVGKSEGNKGHQKTSYELIEKHGTPLGWNEVEMRRAALVARFHCGALPAQNHKALRDLLPEEQRAIIRLSAILRLANALDAAHDGRVRRVKLEFANTRPRRTNGFLHKQLPGKDQPLVIAAEGYADGTATAQTVAAERYLLETVLRRPVIVRVLRAS